MHTRITKYCLKKGKTREALQLVRDHWVEQISKSDGFVSFEMVETEDDELVGLLTYQTQDQTLDALEVAKDWVFKHFGDLLAEPSIVTMGTVEISTHRDVGDHQRRG